MFFVNYGVKTRLKKGLTMEEGKLVEGFFFPPVTKAARQRRHGVRLNTRWLSAHSFPPSLVPSPSTGLLSSLLDRHVFRLGLE